MRGTLWNAMRVAAALTALVTLTNAGAQAAPGPRAYVDPAGKCHGRAPCYGSIQVAVDRSPSGSLVLVSSGTYRERVVVNKALTLRGRGATIAGGRGGTVLTLTGNGATIAKLSLTGGDVGVRLRGASANRLLDLRVAHTRTGIFFSGQSRKNLVRDTEVSRARRFAIDVGDQDDSGNRFLRLFLHDSATGFNAYRGSDNLLLEGSTIRRIAPGPGVVVGWSEGWRVEDNEIVGNATGVLTDTVESGTIVRNFIAHNTSNGIEEAGLLSTVTTHSNRIEGNGRSGIALCIAARGNDVRGNVIADNARYGIEICAHPSPAYFNVGNTVGGNYLFAGAALGDAADDQGSNSWLGNYYSRDYPWKAPFAIPGAAGAQDPSPLTVGDLPRPASPGACEGHGWWLLTDGTAPFESREACMGLAQTMPGETVRTDKDCSDFATQRAAQIYFLSRGGPQRDPDRLDGDHDGVACEDNPCPCYSGSQPPPRAARAAPPGKRRASYQRAREPRESQ